MSSARRHILEHPAQATGSFPKKAGPGNRILLDLTEQTLKAYTTSWFKLMMGSSIANTIIKGVKARLKNGGPTETFSPLIASATSGQTVPKKTTAAATASKMLFRTSPLSLLTHENAAVLRAGQLGRLAG